MASLQRIGVIGAGTMGTDIGRAESFLLSRPQFAQKLIGNQREMRLELARDDG
jgi:hypothetical protein